MTTTQPVEPLLEDDPSRTYALFPLKYPRIWKAYKDLCSTFWTAEEVDLDSDKVDFEEKMTQPQKHYLCTTLAFFASADCIVNLNLLNNFCSEVKNPEASCFLAFQSAQENIHAEVYNLMIDQLCDSDEHHTFEGTLEHDGDRTYFYTPTKEINMESAAITYTIGKHSGKLVAVEPNKFELEKCGAKEQLNTAETELHLTISRKDHLFNSLITMPSIKKKGEWALRWADSQCPFAERLVAWAVVEGLLFASSFASIAFFKHKGILPGVGTVNEWIARDESAHANFACMLLRDYVVNRPSVETVHAIFREAILIEDEFVESSLPVRLIGINCEEMKTYVRYCANRLLKAMNYPLPTDAPFNPQAKSPWKWINLLSVGGMTSFFEKRVADYAKSTINKSQINFDATF